MSKVTAPLLSFGASGQIAKTQVYSRWKGRPYVRRYVIPSNPNTTDQQQVRTMWSWLNDFYRNLPAGAVLSWDLAANSRQMTGRNIFLKQNMPIMIPETTVDLLIGATAAGGGPASGVLTLTPGNDQITIDMSDPTIPTGWTITQMGAIAMKEQNPATDEPTQIHYVSDSSTPFSVVMSGLESAQTYRVWAWMEYTKPNLTQAFSAQRTDTALTT